MKNDYLHLIVLKTKITQSIIAGLYALSLAEQNIKRLKRGLTGYMVCENIFLLNLHVTACLKQLYNGYLKDFNIILNSSYFKK